MVGDWVNIRVIDELGDGENVAIPGCIFKRPL